MTEADWNCCDDPAPMLEFLENSGRASERKLRLFACACSRRYLHLTRDPRVGEALHVAERFADGLAGDGERSNARKAAQRAAQVRGVATRPEAPKWERRAASLAYYAAARQGMEAAWNVPGLAVEVLVWYAGGYDACEWSSVKVGEGLIHSGLLRDVFGPLPFREVLPDPAWLAWHGGTVVKLAEAAYTEREMLEGTLDNAQLAVLADALEDAGGTNEEVLAHLRQQGQVHVRGCWVVDLLLGKE
jgi:hypothetical protein